MKIAALACSYNRLNKTAAFLQSLQSQPIPQNSELDIYLLDDNSPDGTADYVQKNFPAITVIKGTGSLFWAGGMRTLWKEVLKRGEYDFYLLLNDDVVLFENAISRLFDAYKLSEQPGNILLGGVRDPQKQKMTYGGMVLKNKLTANTKMIEPDEAELKACDIGNANIMLVDKAAVNRIGIFSDSWTHAFADFDYTLTAKKNGVKVWLAPGYYGYCENDHEITWLSQETPLKKRIEYLYSPKGLSLKDYLHYLRRHFPWAIPEKYMKAWLKTFFPFIYDNFKKTPV